MGAVFKEGIHLRNFRTKPWHHTVALLGLLMLFGCNTTQPQLQLSRQPIALCLDVDSCVAHIHETLTKKVSEIHAPPNTHVLINIKLDKQMLVEMVKLINTTGNPELDSQLLKLVPQVIPSSLFVHLSPQEQRVFRDFNIQFHL